MGDQDRVHSETVDENQVLSDPAIIIGWNPAGKFLVACPLANPFQALALLEKAKIAILNGIPADKAPQAKVLPISGLPPALQNGRVN